MQDTITKSADYTVNAINYTQKMQAAASALNLGLRTRADAVKYVQNEFQELCEALTKTSNEAVASEIGDLMYCLVRLAFLCGADASVELIKSTKKASMRFARVLELLPANGSVLSDAQMDALYQKAKCELLKAK